MKKSEYSPATIDYQFFAPGVNLHPLSWLLCRQDIFITPPPPSQEEPNILPEELGDIDVSPDQIFDDMSKMLDLIIMLAKEVQRVERRIEKIEKNVKKCT